MSLGPPGKGRSRPVSSAVFKPTPGEGKEVVRPHSTGDLFFVFTCMYWELCGPAFVQGTGLPERNRAHSQWENRALDPHTGKHLWNERFERKRQRRSGASREGLPEEATRGNGEGQDTPADPGSWCPSRPLWTLPLSSAHLTEGKSPFSFNFL